MKSGKFTFEISLSVLEHLGRNLYRSFATVLGEAISNSWDADALGVRIYYNGSTNSLVVKDDGDGMTSEDFQDKFLKIGYSKRKAGASKSPGGRPFIGRKGIGKLALLSCAEKVHIISKVKGGEYVGGVIDNSGLDDAITEDLTPNEYTLGKPELKTFDRYTKDHEKGTIIYFENLKQGMKNSVAQLRKIIALHFRFSLVDKAFSIFLEDKLISPSDLQDLAERTEFVWIINALDDPYITDRLTFKKGNKDVNLVEPPKQVQMAGKIKGFIASVRKPSDLKIPGLEDRVSVDLLANGRLRERDILRHIPTAKVPESYLYGHVHLDALDDDKDRFATSREGVVADDPMFASMMAELRKTLGSIINEWDKLRIRNREDGDAENPRITARERKASELYSAVSADFVIEADPAHPERKEKVDNWVDELAEEARYNFPSYAECFIAENLIRKHIADDGVPLTPEARRQVKSFQHKEAEAKNAGNISIPIRKTPTEISYLSMDALANLVDKRDKIKEASLSRDAGQYKPIRDAIMHTALLTEDAKRKLTSVFANIRERVRNLLGS